MTTDNENREVLKGNLHLQEGHGFTASSWCVDYVDASGEKQSHELKKGDILMIFNDAAQTEPVWSGVIDFDYKKNLQVVHAWGFMQQKLEGLGTIHGLPPGGDQVEKEWLRLFKAEKPALLVKAPKV